MLFAVLVPAVCLIWFMGAAMQNEQMAARQKLAEAYRAQLSSSQVRLQQFWKSTATELVNHVRMNPPSIAFHQCVLSGNADSVLIFDERGRLLYPNAPSGSEIAATELEPNWAEANRLEYLRKDFGTAAKLYGSMAKAVTSDDVAARALQAEARCLVRDGQAGAAVRLITDSFGHKRFERAADPQGRLIAANAELLALELIADRASFRSIAERLRQRLMDYENPVLASPQRRFLMKELKQLAPGIEFPTLAAEDLAAQFSDNPGIIAREAGLQRATLPGFWQFGTPDQRVLALIQSEKLLARLQSATAPDNLPSDMHFTLLPPGTENEAAFVSLPAGAEMPGWRLALSFKDQNTFAAATQRRRVVYLWTGILVLAAMGMLTLLAVRLLRQKVALARLKNDLAATVSHELKTPLSSMRVLVDTLLNSETLDEQTTREYLQLIAQENERLSRLIQNFLTFSRMERKNHVFHFAPLPARQIIDTAVKAVGERLSAPGCRFEVQLEPDLPDIMADSDAMSAALINLLDNACKYSEDIKHIVLRARAGNGHVAYSVQDNGVGIAPRELKRIFRHFYQVDQRLSRESNGCGLGLSIVQSIVTAHDGSVSVDSHPGRGSTFTITVPTAPGVMRDVKEAVA